MSLKVLVLRVAGTNCDWETAHGLAMAGASPERVHIGRLLERGVSLADYGMLVIPGGFSYGDDLSAGRVLANELRLKLADQVFDFAARGRPIIGICNGFQALLKAGLLPVPGTGGKPGAATLAGNDSGRFEARWVRLWCTGRSFLLDGVRGEQLALPVAHGEGKFLTRPAAAARRLAADGRAALLYVDDAGRPARAWPANPNGSAGALAALSNEAGNVLGLMPHPERFLFPWCHPAWTRGEGRGVDGLRVLKSFVNACR